jgi:hypothetical protein
MMIPPLQQQMELMKQQGGRQSEAINQIINQDPNNVEEFINKENMQEVGTDTGPSAIGDDDCDQVLELLRRRRERLDQG